MLLMPNEKWATNHVGRCSIWLTGRRYATCFQQANTSNVRSAGSRGIPSQGGSCAGAGPAAEAARHYLVHDPEFRVQGNPWFQHRWRVTLARTNG